MPDSTEAVYDEITEKKLILVEGKDDIIFFNKFLEYIEITDFRIEEYSGKDNFKNKIPALKAFPGFSNIEYLIILRDADNDFESSFKSVKDALERNGLPAPTNNASFSNSQPKVGIYLLPGNSQNGMLEDLCLKIVEDEEVLSCVNEFIECASKHYSLKNESKSRMRAFLSVKDGEIITSIGAAAGKEIWNFDSPHLDELKRFFDNIR